MYIHIYSHTYTYIHTYTLYMHVHILPQISSPAVFISPLADPNISIGPLPHYQNTPHSFNIPHGVKKHVKRKLTFDTVTQISEKHFERNLKSWMSNNQCKKKVL